LGHHGKSDGPLIGAAAVAVVEVVEPAVVADELPEGEGGFGKGKAGEDFPVKVLMHGPVLEAGGEDSPTP
jgi:hypothetical protein